MSRQESQTLMNHLFMLKYMKAQLAKRIQKVNIILRLNITMGSNNTAFISIVNMSTVANVDIFKHDLM